MATGAESKIDRIGNKEKQANMKGSVLPSFLFYIFFYFLFTTPSHKSRNEAKEEEKEVYDEVIIPSPPLPTLRFSPLLFSPLLSSPLSLVRHRSILL